MDNSSTPAPVLPQITLPPTRIPGAPYLTPTPNSARVLPTLRVETVDYVVKAGDSLGKIAKLYGISLNSLIAANEITDPDLLEIGQQLIIPPPIPVGVGPSTKIIPDSELIFGPVSLFFDLSAYIAGQNSALADYSEEIEGEMLTGSQIIDRISREYSINPRLLLAVLEYQGKWISQSRVDEIVHEYPLGYMDRNRPGLYRQLAWASNQLNMGFYLWEVNGLSSYILADGSIVIPSTLINSGTVGVQYLMSKILDYDEWNKSLSNQEFQNTYTSLFGNPFDVAIEPYLPASLEQPDLELPFEPGIPWSFTGGPHGGWGDGSAWAALDFAPPGETAYCAENDAWVTAVADGLVTRSGNGVVILDLDFDGYEQTGWTILYLHVESRDRVPVGRNLQRGDKIGHPSCEGGVANATHFHIARRYNGVWISADGTVPFKLSDWTSEGTGIEYNGFLINNGQVVEAWDYRREENQIQH